MVRPITGEDLRSVLSFEDLARLFHEKLEWPSQRWRTFSGVAELYGLLPDDIPGVVSLSAVEKLTEDLNWGIFLVDFGENPLKRSQLRRILARVADRARQTHANPTWPHERILFVCRSITSGWQMGLFVGGTVASASLKTFGWTSADAFRTLLEWNLPALAWPLRDGWASAWDVESLTDKFYGEYRLELDRAALMIDHPGGSKVARSFVQSLFNRLLFIAFVQQMGWLRLGETRSYLQNLFEAYRLGNRAGTKDFYARLELLFFSALNSPNDQGGRDALVPLLGDVPYLNGGLFRRDPNLDVAGVEIPDEVFRSLLDAREGLFARYNFTVTESTPLDIEVAIDPEMLGKMFEELVTGRQESGSFYTPRPVVSFMCRESLRHLLLRTGIEDARLESFINTRNAGQLDREEAQELLTELRSIKVVDPACGSGAYLLGMLHELFELMGALELRVEAPDAGELYRRKLHIIENSIFGVDLDVTAVNIARLRLWLSLAVEYTGEEPEPLPSLDYKVEAGDAVAGPDPTGGQLDAFREEKIASFSALKEQFGRPGEGTEALRKQVVSARNEIAAWVLGPGVTAAFDWRVDFADVFGNGGFDIVVANPPYVRQELILSSMGREYKSALEKAYKDACGGKSDLYCYFYARAIQLLKPGGIQAFICSSSWLDVGFGGRLQRYLLERSHVLAIYDSAVERQFATAEVNTIISFVRKGRAADTGATEFISLRAPFERAILDPALQHKVIRTREDLWRAGVGEGHAFEGDKWGAKYLRAPDIYWKIREATEGLGRLNDIAEVRFGIKTGANDFFYLRVLSTTDGIARVECDDGSEHEIESRFLFKAVKTPRDYYAITIRRSDIYLFWCKESRQELAGTRALAYIQYGEARGVHKTPSCQSRRQWYTVSGPGNPTLLWPSAFFERHIVYECPPGYVADKVFYTISGDVPICVRAFLNSTVVSLFVETEGYQLNHGGIFVTTEWLAKMPISTASTEAIRAGYQLLGDRNIELCQTELGLPDRRALDMAILESLELDPGLVDELYASVRQAVSGRIHRTGRKTTRLEGEAGGEL